MKKTIVSTFAILIMQMAYAQEKSISLDSCILYAFQHNRDLLIRAKNNSIEENNIRASKYQLLPDVTLSTGVDYYWKIPVQLFPAQLFGGQAGQFIPVRLGRPYMGNYGVEADLDLVNINKWKDIKLALLQKKLANGDMEAYKKELEKNIRLSYYNIALAKKKKATADSIYASYSIVDSLISLKFNEGITDKITRNQSKSILSQDYSKSQSAATDLRIAVLNLKVWMNYPFNEELSIDPEISLPDYSFAPFDAALAPEYELKQLTAESAKQNWQKAKTAWIPKLSLQSGYSKTGFGDNLSFISDGGWYPSGYVGLKLSVPISSLYKLKPYADSQKISWEQSKLDLDSYVNKKEKEFLEAKLLLEKYKEKLRSSEQDLLLAKENVALTLQKLRDGIIDMAQLKQVQDDLYKLQDEYSDSYLNYITSYINLNYLQSKKQ